MPAAVGHGAVLEQRDRQIGLRYPVAGVGGIRSPAVAVVGSQERALRIGSDEIVAWQQASAGARPTEVRMVEMTPVSRTAMTVPVLPRVRFHAVCMFSAAISVACQHHWFTKSVSLGTSSALLRRSGCAATTSGSARSASSVPAVPSGVLGLGQVQHMDAHGKWSAGDGCNTGAVGGSLQPGARRARRIPRRRPRRARPAAGWSVPRRRRVWLRGRVRQDRRKRTRSGTDPRLPNGSATAHAEAIQQAASCTRASAGSASGARSPGQGPSRYRVRRITASRRCNTTTARGG